MQALILDTQREIERLKAVVVETKLLLAHSREVINSSRHLLAMLEHDCDARILTTKRTGWTLPERGADFDDDGRAIVVPRRSSY